MKIALYILMTCVLPIYMRVMHRNVAANTDNVHLAPMVRSQKGSAKKVVGPQMTGFLQTYYYSQVKDENPQIDDGQQLTVRLSGRQQGTEIRSNSHNKHTRKGRKNPLKHMEFLLNNNRSIGGIHHTWSQSDHFSDTTNGDIYNKAERTSRRGPVDSSISDKYVPLYSAIIALLTPNFLAQHDKNNFYKEVSVPKEITGIVNTKSCATPFWCNICRTLTIETRFCKYILSRDDQKYVTFEAVSDSSRHGQNSETTENLLPLKLSHILNSSAQNHAKTMHFNTLNKQESQRKLLSIIFTRDIDHSENNLDGQNTLYKETGRLDRMRRSENETAANQTKDPINMTEYIKLVERLRQYRSKDPMWAMMSCMAILVVLAWAAWACGMRRIDRSKEITVAIEDELHFVSIREILRLRRPFLPKHIFKFRKSKWKYSRLQEADLADAIINTVDDDTTSDYSEDRDLYSPMDNV